MWVLYSRTPSTVDCRTVAEYGCRTFDVINLPLSLSPPLFLSLSFEISLWKRTDGVPFDEVCLSKARTL